MGVLDTYLHELPISFLCFGTRVDISWTLRTSIVCPWEILRNGSVHLQSLMLENDNMIGFKFFISFLLIVRIEIK